MRMQTIKRFKDSQKACLAAIAYSDFFQSESTMVFDRNAWIIRFDKEGQFLSTKGTLINARTRTEKGTK